MKNKFSIAMTLAMIVAMLVTSLALADNVHNDVVSGGNDTITVGGSTTINYSIQGIPNDGQTGNPCNASDGSPATVMINTPAGVTVDTSGLPGNQATLTFTSCGTSQSAIFSSSTVGDHAITVSVSDAGTGTYNTNPAAFTLHVQAAPPPSDTTAPVITFTGTAPNANGWNNTDVTVSWSVTDPESSITSSSGCGTTTVTAETNGTTYTCIATSAGGTNSQSVTVRIDKTKPVITGSRSPLANANGWNNTDVAVSFSCAEAGSVQSGLDINTVTGATVSTEGTNQSVTSTGSCTDKAGNAADSATVSGINIDTTKPVITGSRTPVANANGWNNSDVVVSFTCADNSGSGIDTNTVAGATVTGEGAGQSVTNTGSCTDKAGNSADPATVSGISIDKTKPVIAGSASPTANGFGWNNTDVVVSFSCTDALSTVDTNTVAGATVTGEGAGQSVTNTGTCTDKAGNTADSATVSGINIDLTAPSVSLVGGPSNGGTYYFGFVPAAPDCIASDALSGLDGACSVDGYSDAIGSHTVTASATDKAGNSAGASASYTVDHWTLTGFYQPVDMHGVFNVVKGGSTVPFKFEVFAGSTELTDVAYLTGFRYGPVACDATAPNDAIETLATGETSLRYDWTSGQFIYNWKTPRTTGCFSVTMTADDGSTLTAFFKLK